MSRGCCWDSAVNDVPWCFHPVSDTAALPKTARSANALSGCRTMLSALGFCSYVRCRRLNRQNSGWLHNNSKRSERLARTGSSLCSLRPPAMTTKWRRQGDRQQLPTTENPKPWTYTKSPAGCRFKQSIYSFFLINLVTLSYLVWPK